MKNRSNILLAILPVLACVTVLPGARAVTPPPDGCYPNFTTAEGCAALTTNTIGDNNVALGTLTLSSNTSGTDNTAIGNLALQNSVNNSNHVVVGRLAGSGITSVDNNIIIGHHNGVHSRFGEEGGV